MTNKKQANTHKIERTDYLKKAILEENPHPQMDPRDLHGLENLTFLEDISDSTHLMFRGSTIAFVKVDNSYNYSTKEYSNMCCFSVRFSDEIPTGSTHYLLGNRILGRRYRLSENVSPFNLIGGEIVCGIYRNDEGHEVVNLQSHMSQPVIFFGKKKRK